MIKNVHSTKDLLSSAKPPSLPVTKVNSSVRMA